ncbi:hypothetical protein INR49_028162, partial [Caranx melampygus]
IRCCGISVELGEPVTFSCLCPRLRSVADKSAEQMANCEQQLLALTEDGLEQNYADIHFSGRKFSGARRKRELKPEESLYAQVQCKM